MLLRLIPAYLIAGLVLVPTVQGAITDPVLLYSTYLGGTHAEDAGRIAVDAAGNVYVTGTTWSPDFPKTPGADQTLEGNTDAFVAKFAPDGTLIYSTYVGDRICDQEGNAIAVDAAGNAYMVGSVGNCNSLDYPTGALIVKLDPSGSIIYVFTVGSRLLDTTVGNAIAIDNEGNAYITGSSKTSFNLPTTPGAFQPDSCGGIPEHGFVAKINAAGNALVYCTYLCGSGEDIPTSIAVDSAGHAYVAGATTSYNFPTVNAYQSSNRVGTAAVSGFLTKLNSTGTGLLFSTFLGSSLETAIHDIAIDAAGDIYVTGWNAGSDFPTTPGVVQPSGPSPLCYYGGICADAFVTKFSPDGAVIYSTLVGGEGQDEAMGISIDSDGNAYIIGSTASTVFPLRNAFQTEGRGPDDAFVVKLNHDASRILFSSYLGGDKAAGSKSRTEGGEDPDGIAVGQGGKVWVTGVTTSYDFPVTANAYQPESVVASCVLSGEPCGDLFVSELMLDAVAIPPSCHLDISATDLAPGGSVATHWAGIPSPTANDKILLFQLGRVADTILLQPTFPTTGEPQGTISVTLPNDLAPGTYELRLMVPAPGATALLHVIARSEPLYVKAGQVTKSFTLVPMLGEGNSFHIRITGAEAGNYKVEATRTLNSPDWRVIGTLTVQGDTSEFTDNISQTDGARFYRISR